MGFSNGAARGLLPRLLPLLPSAALHPSTTSGRCQPRCPHPSVLQEWVNATLLPVAADPSDVGHTALASRRLAARVRGLLWRIYSQDSELIRCGLRAAVASGGGAAHRPHFPCLCVHAAVGIQRCVPPGCPPGSCPPPMLSRHHTKQHTFVPCSAMVKVEQRIDGGQLKMKDAEGNLKNLKQAREGTMVMRQVAADYWHEVV